MYFYIKKNIFLFGYVNVHKYFLSIFQIFQLENIWKQPKTDICLEVNY